MKNIAKLAGISFGITLIFTLIDYLFHNYFGFVVPGGYFTNKLVFGTLLLSIAFLLIQNIKPLDKLSIEIKTIIITLAIAFALQIRYLYVYDAHWNLAVLLAHKVILGSLVWLAYRTKLVRQKAFYNGNAFKPWR